MKVEATIDDLGRVYLSKKLLKDLGWSVGDGLYLETINLSRALLITSKLELKCHQCGYVIRPDYKFCPNCADSLPLTIEDFHE